MVRRECWFEDKEFVWVKLEVRGRVVFVAGVYFVASTSDWYEGNIQRSEVSTWD